MKTILTQEEIRALYETKKENFISYALGLTKNPTMAEDLVQEVFLKLLNSPIKKGISGNPFFYILKVIKNLFIDNCRKVESRAKKDSVSVDDESAPNAVLAEVYEQADRDENAFDGLGQDILKCKKSFSSSEKEVFAHMEEGTTLTREIAQKCDIVPSVVSTLKGRIKKKVSDSLEKSPCADEYSFYLKNRRKKPSVFSLESLKHKVIIAPSILKECVAVFHDKDIFPFLTGEKDIPSDDYLLAKVLNAVVVFTDIYEHLIFFNKNQSTGTLNVILTSVRETFSKIPVFQLMLTDCGGYYKDEVIQLLNAPVSIEENSLNYSQSELQAFNLVTHQSIQLFVNGLKDDFLFTRILGFETQMPNDREFKEKFNRIVKPLFHFWEDSFCEKYDVIKKLVPGWLPFAKQIYNGSPVLQKYAEQNWSSCQKVVELFEQ